MGERGSVPSRRYLLPVIALIMSLSAWGSADLIDPVAPPNLNCLEEITCIRKFPNIGRDWLMGMAADLDGAFFAGGWKYIPDSNNAWYLQKFGGDCSLGWHYTSDFDDLDEIIDVALDAKGNVLASGWRFYEGEQSWLVAKFDRQGTLLWMHPYKIDGVHAGYTRAMSVCADNQDTVYVAGFTDYITDVYKAIRKYASDGTFLGEWPIDMEPWDIEYGYDMQSGEHYLVVAGGTENLDGKDIIVEKYDLFGDQKWEYQHDGGANLNDVARGVAITRDQQIFIAGCENSLSSGPVGVLIKLDSQTGDEVGRATYDNSTNDQFWDVAADRRGYIAVAGQREVAGQSHNWVVNLYNTACELLCSTEYNNSSYDSSDVARCLTFDADGDVIVGGYETTDTGTDWLVIKYACVLTPSPSLEPLRSPYQGFLRVFPNPYSRSDAVHGTLKFEGLDLGSKVRIYTTRGLLVWEGTVERPYILEWNGRNEAGKPVAPGTYLWVAESGDSKQRGTLVVE